MKPRLYVLGLLLAAASAWGGQDARYAAYTPPSRHFSCEIPTQGWSALEVETPRGLAVHILGPELVQGAWRAAFHVHLFEKGRPGYEPWPQVAGRIRTRDESIDREATPLSTWRVAGRGAKLFEVRERRWLPTERLPSSDVVLHHFYAVVPAQGEDYFLIKLSTTEQDFLTFRPEFRRFLKSFHPK